MIKKLLLCIYLFAFLNGENYVSVENAQLFYRTKGQGKPLIVLHGGPGLTQDYLLPQLYKLAENNFVIFYDQRGCGRSSGEVTPSSINIETYVADLDAIRKAFHLEKISILGHSWGGFLAMNYAIAHPECVEKLILSNSMCASSDEYARFEHEYIKRMAPFQKELEAEAPGFNENVLRIIFRTYCYNPEKANLLNLDLSPNAATNAAKINEIFDQTLFRHYDLHEALRQLKVPTLVIHGDVDPVPPNTAEKIHQNIKDSKFVLMKNCGHFPYVEDPDVYFNHLESFLR